MFKRSTWIAALAFFLTLCGAFQANAFDTRGSAIAHDMVAYYSSAGYRASYITITNITGNDVEVRVTFYDHSGNDATQYCTIFSGNDSGSGSVTIVTGSGLFSLPAGETRIARFYTGTNKYLHGYATIEWSSTNDNLRQALIATATQYRSATSAVAEKSIAVNSGQPF